MTAIARLQNTLRTIVLFPAYTAAFALPVAMIIGFYLLVNSYCATQNDVFNHGGLCHGVEQLQQSTLFQLP